MGVLYNPFISVDCAVFGFEESDLKVLLINRDSNQDEGISGKMKLPGGLIQRGELLDDSAKRTLRELTGLENIFLKQYGVYDAIGRLNTEDREWLEKESQTEVNRVITIAYYSLIKIDQQKITSLSETFNAQWYSINEIPDLIFDHNDILAQGLDTLRKEVFIDPLAFELLPKKFTLNQLQRLYEVILDKEFDNRNFRKRAKKMDYIIPLDEKQTGVSHKPAQLHKFDRHKFEEFLETYNRFII